MRNRHALAGPCAVAILVMTGASISLAETTAKPATPAPAGTAKPAPAAAAKPATETAMTTTPAKEPDHITVQHILIGFTGSVPGKSLTRTPDEAKKLAYEVLELAKKGENYDELVKKYTDDSAPGLYAMSNKGVPVNRAAGEWGRGEMVAAFGNVGFVLPVGGIGIADYDKATSPFGWHIVKRVK